MSKHSVQNDPQIQKMIEEKNKPKLYTEKDVDLLVGELIDKYYNWSHSSTSRDKLLEIYNQLKNKHG